MKAPQSLLFDLVARVTRNAAPDGAKSLEAGEGFPNAFVHDSGLELIEAD